MVVLGSPLRLIVSISSSEHYRTKYYNANHVQGQPSLRTIERTILEMAGHCEIVGVADVDHCHGILTGIRAFGKGSAKGKGRLFKRSIINVQEW